MANDLFIAVVTLELFVSICRVGGHDASTVRLEKRAQRRDRSSPYFAYRFHSSMASKGVTPRPPTIAQCTGSRGVTPKMGRAQGVRMMIACNRMDTPTAKTSGLFVQKPTVTMECLSLRQLNA
jgi:hypothetical protein